MNCLLTQKVDFYFFNLNQMESRIFAFYLFAIIYLLLIHFE